MKRFPPTSNTKSLLRFKPYSSTAFASYIDFWSSPFLFKTIFAHVPVKRQNLGLCLKTPTLSIIMQTKHEVGKNSKRDE